MISVVTITFNNYDDLIKTVDSLKDAKGDFEHIIINGGSCSKTQEFLSKEFKGRFLSEPDRGISDAFNKGTRLSEGDGVIFLNSGDILIQKNYFALADEKLKNYDFVHADIFLNDILIVEVRLSAMLNIRRGMPYWHQTLVVRKSIFNKVGEFSLNYKIAMDYDFVCRMHLEDVRGYYFREPVVLMDGAGISSIRDFATLREIRKVLRSNNLWNFESVRVYSFRLLKSIIKKVMFCVGMRSLFVLLKKKRKQSFSIIERNL